MEFSLENMCRTCMNEDGTMFSIFSVENRGISKICYADMLMACATLNVIKEDDLPQQICQHCLKHLSISYSFKQQCERSEATLREITKNPDIEFIKEEIYDNETDENNEDDMGEFDNNSEHMLNNDDPKEFKLAQEFLDDHFMPDEEVSEEINESKKLFSDLESIREYVLKPEHNSDEFIENTKEELFEAEFLEDEFVFDNDNIEEKKITVSEFLQNVKETNKNLESEANSVSEKISKPYTDLDRLRKSVLISKSKPGTKILSRDMKCPFCEITFRNKQAFKKHKKQHMKKLKCEICLKEFRSTHGLRYHMKIHNGIKNYACNFENCTKRFRLKQALDKHLSIHNNEKNHLCALCGKTYSTYDALHYHLKAHRGERPYLCIHCGKTFKQSCHLKSHMWVHSGIKPHVCPSCGKCYTSGHQLKKHMRKYCSHAIITEVTDNPVVKTEIITYC